MTEAKISNKKRAMAYRAIERDTLSTDRDIAARADDAMESFLSRQMNDAEIEKWHQREVEWNALND